MKSLRSQVFLAILLAATIPLAVSFALLTNHTSGRLRTAEFDMMERLADEVRRQVSRVYTDASEALHGLTTDPALLRPRMDGERQRELQELRVTHHLFTEISLYDQNGYIIESTSPDSLSQERTEWFKTALSGKTCLSRPIARHRQSGGTGLRFSVYLPVREEHSGDVRVIKATLPFDEVWDVIEGATTANDKLAVLDRFGNVVAGGSTVPILSKFDSRLTPEHWANEPSGSYLLPDNTDYHYVAKSIVPDGTLPNDRLTLIWLRPKSVVSASVHQSVYYLVILGSASVLCAWGLGTLLSRRLAAPFSRAAEVATAVSAGDLDGRLEECGAPEMSLLAKAFNQMLCKVQASQSILESQVQERTVSLEKAKSELEIERQSLAERVDQRTAELRQANKQLEESSRMKDEFLANMSHELRTPLNSILGLSEAMLDGIYGPISEKQESRIGSIESSGRHLLDLINEILDLAKLGAGEMTVDLQPFPLVSTCEAAINFVKLQATQKGLKLNLNIADEVPTQVTADQRRVKQILVNLLSNAVKFTERGSVTLEVSLDNNAKNFCLSVVDTGIGIATKDLGRLFTPFVQLDSSLSRNQSGTGLGLALVSKMVDLHGGKLNVRQSESGGSIFTVSLPLHAVAPDIEELSIPATATNIQKAFVVDDSEIAAEQIARYLEDRGIESSICHSGEAALEKLKYEEPDLIILDIQLPGIGGWELLELLKASPRISQIPVIVISVVEEERKALQLGASQYLVKPVSRDEMMRALDSVSDGGKCILDSGVVISDDNDDDEQHPLLQRTSHAPLSYNPLILIAEDNQANVDTIADYLKSHGFELIYATNGQEAIDKCSVIRPDLILMDIQMPEVDGLTAIRHLKSDPELSSIPVIAVTALAMDGDRVRCLEAGASEYISKPIALKEMVGLIRKQLTNHCEVLPLPS